MSFIIDIKTTNSETFFVSNAENYTKDTQSLNVLRILLGNCLLTSSGHLWRRQRRVIAPAFTAECLSSYLPILAKYSNQCAVTWRSASKFVQKVSATQVLNCITFLAVAAALFGEDLGEHIDAITAIFLVLLDEMADRTVNPFKIPLFVPTKANQRFVSAVKALRCTVADVIALKQERYFDGAAVIQNTDLVT